MFTIELMSGIYIQNFPFSFLLYSREYQSVTCYVLCLLQSKICAPEDQKFDVSSYKNKFRLAAGQYTGKITLDCNSGKSCYNFDIEFKRGK
jgi:hypothetical protein